MLVQVSNHTYYKYFGVKHPVIISKTSCNVKFCIIDLNCTLNRSSKVVNLAKLHNNSVYDRKMYCGRKPDRNIQNIACRVVLIACRVIRDIPCGWLLTDFIKLKVGT